MNSALYGYRNKSASNGAQFQKYCQSKRQASEPFVFKGDESYVISINQANNNLILYFHVKTSFNFQNKQMVVFFFPPSMDI